jgi:ATP/maltotriose-dependent transcriptional regulator MalT
MRELVGREIEMARLRAFLDRLGTGLAVLMIEGEPGIGKTALLEAILVPTGGVTLRARCVPAEFEFGYAGLVDLLERVPEPVLARLPTPQRHVIEVAAGLTHQAGQAQIEPQLVGRATLRLLEELAATGPVLIMIDDVQWLDTASNRALAFALRRLAPSLPIALLLTRRRADDPLPLALDDVLAPPRLERLLLGPLDPGELERLVEGRLSVALPRSVRRRLAAAAGGNPLFALELADAAHRAGADADLSGLPARLEDLLADRLGRLPPETSEALAAVAGIAEPTVALVAAALGEDARTGLDAALDAGVLRIAEGRLRFDHPLLAVAASSMLTPSARRAVHARLAATLTDPEERARHLVEAADGPDAELASAVEQGADQARARGAPEVAAELAEAAARLTPPDRVEELRRRRIAAGYHRVTAGELRRGREHLSAALADAPAGPVRADLRWRVAILLLNDGAPARATELLEAALDEARGDRTLQAIVARRLAGMYWWQGRLTRALDLMRQALSLAQAVGDPRARLDALTMGIFALLYAGELPEDLPGQVERLARAVGPLQPHEDPDLGLAAIDLARGDAGSAAARLERLYRRAVDEGDELALAVVPASLAEVELTRGDWPRAGQLAEAALRTARRLGSPFSLSRALVAVATVEAHLGRVEAAREAAAELIEVAGHGGLVPFELEGRTVLGFLALSCGDAQAAHAQLEPALQQLTGMGVREPSMLRLAWTELDALVELGRLDQAARLAAELDARGRTLERPFALATAARTRGLVHAARGELEDALTELEEALGHHDRLDWPFDRARTVLTLGMVRRRAKQKRAARVALQEAAAVFDQLGARLWSARTAAELSRIGGRTPGTGALTPTERRVAELVAQGHSNREVADRLFLSVKTVAAHLTNVYVKLGVRSRTELTHRLHATGGGEPTAP